MLLGFCTTPKAFDGMQGSQMDMQTCSFLGYSELLGSGCIPNIRPRNINTRGRLIVQAFGQ